MAATAAWPRLIFFLFVFLLFTISSTGARKEDNYGHYSEEDYQDPYDYHEEDPESRYDYHDDADHDRDYGRVKSQDELDDQLYREQEEQAQREAKKKKAKNLLHKRAKKHNEHSDYEEQNESRKQKQTKQDEAEVQIKMADVSDPDPKTDAILKSKAFANVRKDQIQDYIQSHFAGQKLEEDVLVMIDNLITSNLKNELKSPDSRLNRLLKDEGMNTEDANNTNDNAEALEKNNEQHVNTNTNTEQIDTHTQQHHHTNNNIPKQPDLPNENKEPISSSVDHENKDTAHVVNTEVKLSENTVISQLEMKESTTTDPNTPNKIGDYVNNNSLKGEDTVNVKDEIQNKNAPSKQPSTETPIVQIQDHIGSTPTTAEDHKGSTHTTEDHIGDTHTTENHIGSTPTAESTGSNEKDQSANQEAVVKQELNVDTTDTKLVINQENKKVLDKLPLQDQPAGKPEEVPQVETTAPPLDVKDPQKISVEVSKQDVEKQPLPQNPSIDVSNQLLKEETNQAIVKEVVQSENTKPTEQHSSDPNTDQINKQMNPTQVPKREEEIPPAVDSSESVDQSLHTDKREVEDNPNAKQPDNIKQDVKENTEKLFEQESTKTEQVNNGEPSNKDETENVKKDQQQEQKRKNFFKQALKGMHHHHNHHHNHQEHDASEEHKKDEKVEELSEDSKKRQRKQNKEPPHYRVDEEEQGKKNEEKETHENEEGLTKQSVKVDTENTKREQSSDSTESNVDELFRETDALKNPKEEKQDLDSSSPQIIDAEEKKVAEETSSNDGTSKDKLEEEGERAKTESSEEVTKSSETQSETVESESNQPTENKGDGEEKEPTESSDGFFGGLFNMFSSENTEETAEETEPKQEETPKQEPAINEISDEDTFLHESLSKMSEAPATPAPIVKQARETIEEVTQRIEKTSTQASSNNDREKRSVPESIDMDHEKMKYTKEGQSNTHEKETDPDKNTETPVIPQEKTPETLTSSPIEERKPEESPKVTEPNELPVVIEPTVTSEVPESNENNQESDKATESPPDLKHIDESDPLYRLCQSHPTLQACKKIDSSKISPDHTHIDDERTNQSTSTAGYIKSFTRWMNGWFYFFFTYVVTSIQSMVIFVWSYSIGLFLDMIGFNEVAQAQLTYLQSLSVEKFAFILIFIINHFVFYWYFNNSSMGPTVKVINRIGEPAPAPVVDDEKIEKLQDDVSNLEAKLKTKDEEKSALEEKISGLEAKNKELSLEISELNKKLTTEAEADKLTIASLQQKTEGFQENLTTKETELRISNTTLESVKEDLDNMKTEYKELETKFFYVIKELDLKDVKISKMEESETKLNKDLEEKAETITEKDETINTQVTRIEVLLEEKIVLEDSIKDDEKKINDLQREIQVLQESLLSVNKIAVDHETSNEFDNVEEDQEIDAEQLKAERLAKIMDATKAQAELIELKQELQTTQEELAKYNVLANDRENKYNEIWYKFEELTTESSETRKELEKKEIELSTIRKFFADREMDYQKASSQQADEVKVLKKQIDSIGDNDKQISILLKQVEDLKDEILTNEKQLKQQITTAEEQSHNNYIKMRTAIRECDEHKREKEIYRKRLLDIDMTPKFKTPSPALSGGGLKSSTPASSKTPSDRAASPTNSNKSTDDNSRTESPARPPLPPGPPMPPFGGPRMYPGMPPPFMARPPPFGTPPMRPPFGGPPPPMRHPYMSPMNAPGMVPPPGATAAMQTSTANMQQTERPPVSSTMPQQQMMTPMRPPMHPPVGGMPYGMAPHMTPPMTRPTYPPHMMNGTGAPQQAMQTTPPNVQGTMPVQNPQAKTTQNTGQV